MNEQLIADLKGVKHELATRGRCTKMLVDTETEKVCLDAAVAVACGLNFLTSYEDADQDDQSVYDFLDADPRAVEVIKALVSHIPEDHRARRRDIVDVDAVFVYNDDFDITDQDCFTLIDKALAEAGGLI